MKKRSSFLARRISAIKVKIKSNTAKEFGSKTQIPSRFFACWSTPMVISTAAVATFIVFSGVQAAKRPLNPPKNRQPISRQRVVPAAQTTLQTQLFPNYECRPAGSAPMGLMCIGVVSDITPPTLIPNGTEKFRRNNNPVGLSYIASDKPFVEAGPTIDCFETPSSCQSGANNRRAYPYSSYRGYDASGMPITREVVDTRYPLPFAPTTTRFSVKYLSDRTPPLSRWKPKWIDGAGVNYNFPNDPDNGDFSELVWVLGDLPQSGVPVSRLPYVVAGIESYPRGTRIGTVTARNNAFSYSNSNGSAIGSSSWCYENVLKSKDLQNKPTSFSLSACNASDYSWQMTYPTATAQAAPRSRTRPLFRPRSFVNASQADLEKFALDYAQHGLRSGTAKVAAIRYIRTGQDLIDMGLKDIYLSTGGKPVDPKRVYPEPYGIVGIITGDFWRAAFFRGGVEGERIPYVIFSVNSEGHIGSKTSGGFANSIRKALKDPSFPQDRRPDNTPAPNPRGSQRQ